MKKPMCNSNYLKILGLLMLLGMLTSSCKSNLTDDDVDIDLEENIPVIIDHFFSLSNPVAILPNGDSARFSTKRLRDTVKVYLDTTAPSNHLEELKGMIHTIEENIGSNTVVFEIITDTNDYTIAIVRGSKLKMFEFLGLSNYSEPQEPLYGQCGGSNYCTTIKRRHIWYDAPLQSEIRTLKHEFGHAIGLGHATRNESLMWGNLGIVLSKSNLTQIDLDVLKLIYYEGALGITSPAPTDSCSLDETILFKAEEEDFKSFLEDVIRNNYK